MTKTTNECVMYIKNKQVVLVNNENLFVYESSVYLKYKGYFSLCNSKYFSSKTFITGIVENFNKTKYIQICSELYSAPEQWLIDNDFTRYIKPIKIKKITNVKVEGNDK